MTNPEIDKNRYDDAYQAFLTRDMWPFVASVLQVTQNISPDRRYYFAGNGASAAIASHLANDFSKALSRRAMTFHDPALMTCFANDYGYENWLAEALELHGSEGDVVFLISSSGRSPNILRALEVACAKNMLPICLTGPSPNRELVAQSVAHLSVNSEVYNIIECCHMMALCAVVDSINMVTL